MIIECIHQYWPYYHQPKITENILILHCNECNTEKEVDAKEFFAEAVERKEAYIFGVPKGEK